MSTLYSRGPAETFARVISRTRRSASLARPAERYAATAAVYAAPSGVRDASSRDAATSDFQVEIAAVSDAAASDAASERVPPPAERSLVVPERVRFILASALVRPETTSVYARRVGRPPARTYSSNASRTPSGIPALAPCLTSVAIASGGARTPASSISRANAHACGSIPAAHSASTRRWTVVGSEPSVSRKPPGARAPRPTREGSKTPRGEAARRKRGRGRRGARGGEIRRTWTQTRMRSRTPPRSRSRSPPRTPGSGSSWRIATRWRGRGPRARRARRRARRWRRGSSWRRF